MSTETKQPTLLSDLPPEVIGLHRRIVDMHQVHGVTDGKRCATGNAQHWQTDNCQLTISQKVI